MSYLLSSLLLSLKSCCLVVALEVAAVEELSCTVGDSGESAVPAELLMVDEGLVMDCCIGESPEAEEEDSASVEGGLEAVDDNWQLFVFVQDVCPAKVRGGLGGIGST